MALADDTKASKLGFALIAEIEASTKGKRKEKKIQRQAA